MLVPIPVVVDVDAVEAPQASSVGSEGQGPTAARLAGVVARSPIPDAKIEPTSTPVAAKARRSFLRRRRFCTLIAFPLPQVPAIERRVVRHHRSLSCGWIVWSRALARSSASSA